jgi:ABC-type uncharacterized transport system ATPase subunit
METILETRGLSKHFGGLQVINAVDFAMRKGEIHCLIGPNGAGKSTLFRLILGEHAPSSGSILYKGSDITALRSFERIKRGISTICGSPCSTMSDRESSRQRLTGFWPTSTSPPSGTLSRPASATDRSSGWRSAWPWP